MITGVSAVDAKACRPLPIGKRHFAQAPGVDRPPMHAFDSHSALPATQGQRSSSSRATSDDSFGCGRNHHRIVVHAEAASLAGLASPTPLPLQLIRGSDRAMDSRDPIRDFFTFLLGAVLLSMGAFLFFNQVMVSSEPVGRGLRFGQGFGRSWGAAMGRASAVVAGGAASGCPSAWATALACC